MRMMRLYTIYDDDDGGGRTRSGKRKYNRLFGTSCLLLLFSILPLAESNCSSQTTVKKCVCFEETNHVERRPYTLTTSAWRKMEVKGGNEGGSDNYLQCLSHQLYNQAHERTKSSRSKSITQLDVDSCMWIERTEMGHGVSKTIGICASKSACIATLKTQKIENVVKVDISLYGEDDYNIFRYGLKLWNKDGPDVPNPIPIGKSKSSAGVIQEICTEVNQAIAPLDQYKKAILPGYCKYKVGSQIKGQYSGDDEYDIAVGTSEMLPCPFTDIQSQANPGSAQFKHKPSTHRGHYLTVYCDEDEGGQPVTVIDYTACHYKIFAAVDGFKTQPKLWWERFTDEYTSMPCSDFQLQKEGNPSGNVEFRVQKDGSLEVKNTEACGEGSAGLLRHTLLTHQVTCADKRSRRTCIGEDNRVDGPIFRFFPGIAHSEHEGQPLSFENADVFRFGNEDSGPVDYDSLAREHRSCLWAEVDRYQKQLGGNSRIELHGPIGKCVPRVKKEMCVKVLGSWFDANSADETFFEKFSVDIFNERENLAQTISLAHLIGANPDAMAPYSLNPQEGFLKKEHRNFNTKAGSELIHELEVMVTPPKSILVQQICCAVPTVFQESRQQCEIYPQPLALPQPSTPLYCTHMNRHYAARKNRKEYYLVECPFAESVKGEQKDGTPVWLHKLYGPRNVARLFCLPKENSVNGLKVLMPNDCSYLVYARGHETSGKELKHAQEQDFTYEDLGVGGEGPGPIVSFVVKDPGMLYFTQRGGGGGRKRAGGGGGGDGKSDVSGGGAGRPPPPPQKHTKKPEAEPTTTLCKTLYTDWASGEIVEEDRGIRVIALMEGILEEGNCAIRLNVYVSMLNVHRYFDGDEIQSITSREKISFESSSAEKMVAPSSISQYIHVKEIVVPFSDFSYLSTPDAIGCPLYKDGFKESPGIVQIMLSTGSKTDRTYFELSGNPPVRLDFTTCVRDRCHVRTREYNHVDDTFDLFNDWFSPPTFPEEDDVVHGRDLFGRQDDHISFSINKGSKEQVPCVQGIVFARDAYTPEADNTERLDFIDIPFQYFRGRNTSYTIFCDPETGRISVDISRCKARLLVDRFPVIPDRKQTEVQMENHVELVQMENHVELTWEGWGRMDAAVVGGDGEDGDVEGQPITFDCAKMFPSLANGDHRLVGGRAVLRTLHPEERRVGNTEAWVTDVNRTKCTCMEFDSLKLNKPLPFGQSRPVKCPKNPQGTYTVTCDDGELVVDPESNGCRSCMYTETARRNSRCKKDENDMTIDSESMTFSNYMLVGQNRAPCRDPYLVMTDAAGTWREGDETIRCVDENKTDPETFKCEKRCMLQRGDLDDVHSYENLAMSVQGVYWRQKNPGDVEGVVPCSEEGFYGTGLKFQCKDGCVSLTSDVDCLPKYCTTWDIYHELMAWLDPKKNVVVQIPLEAKIHQGESKILGCYEADEDARRPGLIEYAGFKCFRNTPSDSYVSVNIKIACVRGSHQGESISEIADDDGEERGARVVFEELVVKSGGLPEIRGLTEIEFLETEEETGGHLGGKSFLETAEGTLSVSKPPTRGSTRLDSIPEGDETSGDTGSDGEIEEGFDWDIFSRGPPPPKNERRWDEGPGFDPRSSPLPPPPPTEHSPEVNSRKEVSNGYVYVHNGEIYNCVDHIPDQSGLLCNVKR